MTEAEATATLAAIGDVLASYIGLWVSSTFAYLTVAYFIGRELSQFQTVAVTGLYIVAATLFAMGVLGHSEAWLYLVNQQPTAYSAVSFIDTVYKTWIPGLMTVIGAAKVISLFFMYNVRQSAKQT